jgi:MFS family permease
LITIKDNKKFHNFLDFYQNQSSRRKYFDQLILPCLVYALMGAITWAMRGSSGWGGFDGTLIPGMTWAILWNYFAYLRGLDGRISGFWLGIGVSIGGMWGYGQYVSWIQGIFYTNTNVIPYESILVNPIYGYIWFWIVGAIWLGIAGVFLGWALDKNYFNLSRSEKIKKWLPRIEIPLMTALIGWILTILYPQWFFPNYSEVLYTEIACPDCFERTISTNTINFIMLMWWIGAIIVAYIQRINTLLDMQFFWSFLWIFIYAICNVDVNGHFISRVYRLVEDLGNDGRIYWGDLYGILHITYYEISRE